MRKGEVFVVTTEQYDRYGIRAALRAELDFDLDEQLALFLVAHPAEKDDDGHTHFDSQAFVAWLLDHTLVANEPNLLEVHLGSYGWTPKDLEKDARTRKGRFSWWRCAWPWQ